MHPRVKFKTYNIVFNDKSLLQYTKGYNAIYSSIQNLSLARPHDDNL